MPNKEDLLDEETIAEQLDEIPNTFEELKNDIPTDKDKEEIETPEKTEVIEENNDKPEVEETIESEEKPKVKTDEIENPNPEKKDTWEQRYKDSTREAQILAEKDKKATELINKIRTSSANITDEDLLKEYPDLDLEYESKGTIIVLKENLRTKRLSEADKLEREMAIAKDNYHKEMSKIASVYPEINDNIDAFEEYVNKKDPNGLITDLSILADGFMGSISRKPIKNIKKGSVLPIGSKGIDEPSNKPKEITAEDLATLRKSNPKEYNNLIASGDIDIDKMAEEI